ncbi:MAG: hypothetical protein HC830_02460 [Bacteroidetes bacterium]|nr:hypothetical protein [Bacteroidota bacterium]
MKTTLTITFILVGFFFSPVYGQKTEKGSKNKKKTGVLLFNSGFENGSHVVPKSASQTTDDDIVGKDLSVKGPNDWEKTSTIVRTSVFLVCNTRVAIPPCGLPGLFLNRGILKIKYCISG